jgi:hypothetical protein
LFRGSSLKLSCSDVFSDASSTPFMCMGGESRFSGAGDTDAGLTQPQPHSVMELDTASVEKYMSMPILYVSN